MALLIFFRRGTRPLEERNESLDGAHHVRLRLHHGKSGIARECIACARDSKIKNVFSERIPECVGSDFQAAVRYCALTAARLLNLLPFDPVVWLLHDKVAQRSD
jgi:hypothetical protein